MWVNVEKVLFTTEGTAEYGRFQHTSAEILSLWAQDDND